VPANPRAWLVSTGRFKAVDALRRRGRFNLVENVADRSDPASEDVPDPDSVEVTAYG
jgi:RNA polymerase sigma-70 factor (ECF subfamily)